MESQTNPMMITVLIRFAGQINHDHLVAELETAVKRFRRLRQRIVRPRQFLRRPYWEEIPTFKAEDNIERMALPEPAGEEAVAKLKELFEVLG